MTSASFTSSRYLALNATITTVCNGLGLASGFALDAVIVGLFGLSRQTDAYFAALAIPFLVTSTVDTQGPKILVPFFSRGFETNGRWQTWAQLRTLMALSGLLFFGFAAALTAVAWLIMPLQVPGLSPETTKRAVQLQMILAWTVPAQGLSTIVAGALYADHHYLTTTTSRFTTNVVAIAVAALGYQRLGIHALALGLLLGSCVQLGFLLCAAGWRGFKLGRARLLDPGVTRLLPLSVYPLFGQALGGTTVFLENFLGSLLGAGALSVVRYANRISGAIAGVLVGGLVITSLPMLSHYAAGRRLEEMKEALLKTIRFVALLAVPAGLWLVFAGKPMVAMAFERGRFMPTDTARLGLLLGLLAPYILFSRVAGVIEVAFYAMMDTRTPLWATVAFLTSYSVACWLLLASLGVFAFAVAMSSGAIVAALLMIRLLQSRYGSLPWAGSQQFGRRLAIVSAVSVVAFLLGAAANRFIVGGGPMIKAIRFLTASVPGLAAFLGSAVLVKLVNWQYLLDVVRRTPRSTRVADVSV